MPYGNDSTNTHNTRGISQKSIHEFHSSSYDTWEYAKTGSLKVSIFNEVIDYVRLHSIETNNKESTRFTKLPGKPMIERGEVGNIGFLSFLEHDSTIDLEFLLKDDNENSYHRLNLKYDWNTSNNEGSISLAIEPTSGSGRSKNSKVVNEIVNGASFELHTVFSGEDYSVGFQVSVFGTGSELEVAIQKPDTSFIDQGGPRESAGRSRKRGRR